MKQMLEGSFSQHGHINKLSDTIIELEQEIKKLKKKINFHVLVKNTKLYQAL